MVDVNLYVVRGMAGSDHVMLEHSPLDLNIGDAAKDTTVLTILQLRKRKR